MESSLCCLDFSVSSKLLKATLNWEIDYFFSLWVMTATKDWKQSGKPLTIMAMTKLSDTVSPAFLRAAAAVSARMTYSVMLSSFLFIRDVSSVYSDIILGALDPA